MYAFISVYFPLTFSSPCTSPHFQYQLPQAHNRNAKQDRAMGLFLLSQSRGNHLKVCNKYLLHHFLIVLVLLRRKNEPLIHADACIFRVVIQYNPVERKQFLQVEIILFCFSHKLREATQLGLYCFERSQHERYRYPTGTCSDQLCNQTGSSCQHLSDLCAL